MRGEGQAHPLGLKRNHLLSARPNRRPPARRRRLAPPPAPALAAHPRRTGSPPQIAPTSTVVTGKYLMVDSPNNCLYSSPTTSRDDFYYQLTHKFRTSRFSRTPQQRNANHPHQPHHLHPLLLHTPSP